MSFVAPKWDASQGHYVIELVESFSTGTRVAIGRDSQGTLEFVDSDSVHNVTDSVINKLIVEGDRNKWFAKLPSHEQLMKRVRNTFKGEPQVSHNAVLLTTILLTPKQVTLLWTPFTHTEVNAPPLQFDDSEAESEAGTEPEITESNLPPVALIDDTQLSREQYLLTRLRAARARVETEQLRMQYFETTGRMPPDSESDSQDD